MQMRFLNLNKAPLRLRQYGAGFCLALALVGGGLCLPAEARDDSLLMVSIASEPNKEAVKKVHAQVMIDAPPSQVWQTITDYKALRHILPGYDRSDILQDNGSSKRLSIVQRVAPLLPTYHYQVVVREQPNNRVITLQRVSGDFKSLSASYRLLPQSNGTKTLLTYQLHIEPDIELPGTQAIIKANTERSMKALESHIEQAYRKSITARK